MWDRPAARQPAGTARGILVGVEMGRVVVLALLLALAALAVRSLTLSPQASPPASAVASTDTPSADARPSRGEPLNALALTSPTDTDAPAAIQLERGQPGFWQIVQDVNGVWWFRSPDGRLEFMNTVTTVQPFQLARSPDGPHFVSRDYNGGTTHDGDLRAWAEATIARVRSAGFKGLGAWSHPVFHEFDIPITRDLNVWTWMTGDDRRIFSPGWRETAERVIRMQVEPLRDNRNLVGYFTDNELDWSDLSVGPRIYFDGLPATDPNRREVMRIIRQLWPDVRSFNDAWGTDLADYAAMDACAELPGDRHEAYQQLASAWLEHLAGEYFRVTSELVRKYDPNHLILGVRYKGWAPPEVVRASRGYTDAQSLNYYVGDAKLDPEMFSSMYELSGQPVMIGEYAFHALDGRSGNRNTVGFVAQVPDQRARADGYRLFTARMAQVPYIIGADWFQWMDEPPSGRSSDGEDVNFGVVDIDDRPYEQLVAAIQETAPRLNPIHAASHADPQLYVWRESFADKPVMHVPYLHQPVALNGELSDWPAEARIPYLRLAETVGMERSLLPVPNVYLGWTEKGIHIGFEVFDHDIQGSPDQQWWWTRDNVEFWINTRPVPPSQASYDPHSHQFFFLPREFPQSDGVAGIIGQWHRNGDAIADHLVPHPKIERGVRILHDRYVVEVFIPADALHEFDPIAQPQLAFNFTARNFQHATSYFWSAPKEVLTQLRPNTWGILHLQPRTQITQVDMD